MSALYSISAAIRHATKITRQWQLERFHSSSTKVGRGEQDYNKTIASSRSNDQRLETTGDSDRTRKATDTGHTDERESGKSNEKTNFTANEYNLKREIRDKDQIEHKKVTHKQQTDAEMVQEDVQTTRQRDLAKMRAMGIIDEDQPEKDINNLKARNERKGNANV